VDQAQLRVVNTSDDGAVDQAQLTSTLPKLLVRRHRGDISNVVAVILNGTPNQMDPTAVDYTGYATFSVPLASGRDGQAGRRAIARLDSCTGSGERQLCHWKMR
jgi:hypothetical protein